MPPCDAVSGHIRLRSVAAVDLAAMAHGKREHHAAVILDTTDQPIVTDAITPESGQRALQGMPKTSRIFAGRQSLDHEPLDARSGATVQAPDLPLDLAGQFNALGHRAGTHPD